MYDHNNLCVTSASLAKVRTLYKKAWTMLVWGPFINAMLYLIARLLPLTAVSAFSEVDAPYVSEQVKENNNSLFIGGT